MRLAAIVVMCTFILSGSSALAATEYFVSPRGSDGADGLGPDRAFATVQRGVDALAAGDTLTILPGEYYESVFREGLGSAEVETLIRAAIPGTAVLRGDVAAPEFEPVDGFRFIYGADFPSRAEAVLELDTLSVLQVQPSLEELEFIPGAMFYDSDAGRLYISSSDLKPPPVHVYRVAVTPASGLRLDDPQRVVIDGLVATGFHRGSFIDMNYAESYIWGIILNRPDGCIVRNCTAYLNASGIAVLRGEANNLIENCTVYGNESRFQYEAGGILRIGGGTGDVIRDCVGYRSRLYGIRFYAQREGPPLLQNNITWGTSTQIKGEGTGGVAEGCIILGNGNITNLQDSVIAGRNGYMLEERVAEMNNIRLTGVDVNAQFADPLNLDFRLQATSKYRGTGTDGRDRGAFPYEPVIYYVSTDGDDRNDGLSIDGAFATADRAMEVLAPGITVYFEPGNYSISRPVQLPEARNAPVSLRGRGVGGVVIEGDVALSGGGGLSVERLFFAAPVAVAQSVAVEFKNCTFDSGLSARGGDGLHILNCVVRHAPVTLSNVTGGIFASTIFSDLNSAGIVIRSGSPPVFSDYNAWPSAGAAWQLAGEELDLAAVRQMGNEIHSVVAAAEFVETNGVPLLANSRDFAGRGMNAVAIGLYRPQALEAPAVAGPFLHSATPTTANFEWWVSHPAEVELAWGPENGETESTVLNFDGFGSFSMTNLEPGASYTFEVVRITPHDRDMGPLAAEAGMDIHAVVTIETPTHHLEPRDLYVAADGNDGADGVSPATAWRTVTHAAAHARPGDTVWIAGGNYPEMVRVRTTGSPGAPITFRAMPGAVVWFDGVERTLPNAFTLTAKSHIVFDGLRFRNQTTQGAGGVVYIRGGGDITLSRCLSDSRGQGYGPSLVKAYSVEDLIISNCLIIGAFGGGIFVTDSPGFVLENSVLLQNLIADVHVVNLPHQSATIRNTIITDALPVKARATLIAVGRFDSLVEENNCYFMRIPSDERDFFLFYSDFSLQRALDAYGISYGEDDISPPTADNVRMTLDDYVAAVPSSRSIAADPQFAALVEIGSETVEEVLADLRARSAHRMYPIDVLLRSRRNQEIDFADVFATNPDVIARSIGLQPEVFE